MNADNVPGDRFTDLSAEQKQRLPEAFSRFLDAASTATARGTFYNTREEQEAAVLAVHADLLQLHRGLYVLSLLLPGLTDYTRQLGVLKLLRDSPRADEQKLMPTEEAEALEQLANSLPPQRILKLCGMLRSKRINNARCRQLILSTILGSQHLEFRAVKYRRKIESALVHAWGRRLASIIRSILMKPVDNRTDKERRIIRRHLERYSSGDSADLEQCVLFVLRGRMVSAKLPRLIAYQNAKSDLESGSSLPFETLEGLRSRFHQNRTTEEVLALTRSQLTTGQQLALQRKAQDADIDITFDPLKYDSVRLYVYAYEMGLNDEIRQELQRKAKALAARLPVRFDHAAIVLDVSASMVGHSTQAMRPISIALALRDVLAEKADMATIISSDGRVARKAELVEPEGDTSLASALIAVLKRRPDTVFVLSDGYENAPAGRFADVVHSIRKMGINTPIHQFSPVFAAECRGVRSLCDLVPGLPVSKPDAIGLSVLKVQLETNLERGLIALRKMANSKAGNAPAKYLIKEQEHGVA